MTHAMDFFPFCSGAVAFSNAKYGQGVGMVLLDHVVCNGTEDSIINCTHDGIGTSQCEHKDDAGVRCQSMTCSCQLLPMIDAPRLLLSCLQSMQLEARAVMGTFA